MITNNNTNLGVSESWEPLKMNDLLLEMTNIGFRETTIIWHWVINQLGVQNQLIFSQNAGPPKLSNVNHLY